MRRKAAVIAIAGIVALCGAILLQLSRARRVEFVSELWEKIEVVLPGTPPLRFLDVNFHGATEVHLDVPAELVLRSFATTRFRRGFADRIAHFGGLEGFPHERPFDVEVRGDPRAGIRWRLPRPLVQRLSLVDFEWVRARGAAAEAEEERLVATLEEESKRWLEEHEAIWREDLRRDTERRIEIVRRSLGLRRATGDLLCVSENWRQGRAEDWDARTERLERHLAALARVEELLRDFPPVRCRREILLEGDAERDDQIALGRALESPGALRDLLGANALAESEGGALPGAPAPLLAARDRLEIEALGGAIPIDPDPRLSPEELEHVLAALGGALARPGAIPWYRSEPFGRIVIGRDESGWDRLPVPGGNPLELPTRESLRIPAGATTEMIGAWLDSPME